LLITPPMALIFSLPLFVFLLILIYEREAGDISQ